MNEYMKERYRKRRLEAFSILGGKCAKCGSTENMEIDHINREDKSFELSKLWNCAKDKFLRELKVCQILCKSCHKEKSDGELSVNHGEGLTGKRNCYCYLCRPLKREYNRIWRQCR